MGALVRMGIAFSLKIAAGPSLSHKAWDTCIDYYVLGLRFEDWFLTISYCEKRMAH